MTKPYLMGMTVLSHESPSIDFNGDHRAFMLAGLLVANQATERGMESASLLSVL